MAVRPRGAKVRASLVRAALLLAVLLLAGPAGADPRTTASSRDVRGVVELFTSQGCSSCPPADRVLATLAKDRGIVALAYHVDYWDYIGWPDPHGSRANTERQRAYAAAFGTGTIYTPQMVVNGRRDVVGSHDQAVAAALQDTGLGGASGARVDLSIRDGLLHISADAGAYPREHPPVLMLVTFLGRADTEVGRGENKGLTLVDRHVVRDWRILGLWDGRPFEIDMPLAALKQGAVGNTGCAAILQTAAGSGGPGPILAAAALEF